MSAASDRAFQKRALAYLEALDKKDRKVGVKREATILSLRRTLTAIADTNIPGNPHDAADKLERMKRMAAFALSRSR